MNIALLQEPCHAPAMTPERRAAIEHAVRLMEEGVTRGEGFRVFSRNEMQEQTPAISSSTVSSRPETAP